jgi:hypothetical protein
LSWNVGQHVFTNSLAGTGNPDGTSLFRSSVNGPPIGGFLTNEDYIAFADDAQPTIIGSLGNVPIPSTLALISLGLAGLRYVRIKKRNSISSEQSPASAARIVMALKRLNQDQKFAYVRTAGPR